MPNQLSYLGLVEVYLCLQEHLAGTKLFLQWKNAKKCATFLYATNMNECDLRRLPALEGLKGEGGGGGGGGGWISTLDLQNAFWTIGLPKRWSGEFLVKRKRGVLMK